MPFQLPPTDPSVVEESSFPLPAIICIAIGGYVLLVVLILFIRSMLMQKGFCKDACTCCGKEGEPGCCECWIAFTDSCNCLKNPNVDACLNACCPRRKKMDCAEIIMCQCCAEGGCCGLCANEEPICDKCTGQSSFSRFINKWGKVIIFCPCHPIVSWKVCCCQDSSITDTDLDCTLCYDCSEFCMRYYIQQHSNANPDVSSGSAVMAHLMRQALQEQYRQQKNEQLQQHKQNNRYSPFSAEDVEFESSKFEEEHFVSDMYDDARLEEGVLRRSSLSPLQKRWLGEQTDEMLACSVRQMLNIEDESENIIKTSYKTVSKSSGRRYQRDVNSNTAVRRDNYHNRKNVHNQTMLEESDQEEGGEEYVIREYVNPSNSLNDNKYDTSVKRKKVNHSGETSRKYRDEGQSKHSFKKHRVNQHSSSKFGEPSEKHKHTKKSFHNKNRKADVHHENKNNSYLPDSSTDTEEEFLERRKQRKKSKIARQHSNRHNNKE